jgi:hypothetical protein
MMSERTMMSMNGEGNSEACFAWHNVRGMLQAFLWRSTIIGDIEWSSSIRDKVEFSVSRG